MNNKTRKILIIISIIILLFGIVIVLNVMQTKNYKSLTISKLERMKDSELVDLFYNTSTENEFVGETSKDYNCGYTVVANVEEAIEETRTIGQSDNTELLELRLAEETDYYYVIYQKYISYRKTGNVTFEDYYLYLKNSILDINNKTININILNNANKIKEIFDLSIYGRTRNNNSIKLLLSEITEKSNEYIYTYYYFNTSLGDWGVSDEIKLYKNTITINKKSGKYESEENRLRKVTGRYNPNPY